MENKILKILLFIASFTIGVLGTKVYTNTERLHDYQIEINAQHPGVFDIYDNGRVVGLTHSTELDSLILLDNQ